MKTELQTEIPLKQWRAEEAERCGIGQNAVDRRMAAGKYPNLKLRRVNKRVVFVVMERK